MSEERTTHTEATVIATSQGEVVVSRTKETATTREDGQDFEKIHEFVQSKDGRTLSDPESQRAIASCASCGHGPYSGYATTYCSACQIVICRQQCTKTLHGTTLCPSCYRKAWRKWLWEWLTSTK